MKIASVGLLISEAQEHALMEWHSKVCMYESLFCILAIVFLYKFYPIHPPLLSKLTFQDIILIQEYNKNKFKVIILYVNSAKK